MTAEKYNFYEVGDISGLKWKMDGGDLVDSTKVLLCRCRKCIKLYHIYIYYVIQFAACFLILDVVSR